MRLKFKAKRKRLTQKELDKVNRNRINRKRDKVKGNSDIQLKYVGNKLIIINHPKSKRLYNSLNRLNDIFKDS